MCRIAGIIDKSRELNLAHAIKSMTDSMRHGGPDDEGHYLNEKLSVALGHRRLSLLDLSLAGHQPMCDGNGEVIVVFNGEIYNFGELKRELEAEGFTFKTRTDTEVIISCFIKWGAECFTRFNGMFAIAILSIRQNKIYLARDHAGIKPLYYHLGNERLIFSSEIRAFKQCGINFSQDPMWQALFLLFGHIPEPFTTLEGVKTLKKGHYLEVDIATLSSKLKNIDDETKEVIIHDETEAIQLVKNSLEASVKRHLISDAPIGLFLSGGIDSSILTLIAAPLVHEQLHTLSIEFEETRFSEAKYQDLIVSITKAKNAKFKVSQADLIGHLEDILDAMDQPSIDGINTYFISMFAKQVGLKAVLSGIGGDELFGGYPSFSRYVHWRKLRKLPQIITSLLPVQGNYLTKLSFLHYPELLSLYLMNRGIFSIRDAATFAGVNEADLRTACNEIESLQCKAKGDIQDNAHVEFDMYMKNQLLKDADYMAMWHSIEVRVPFLDKNFIADINSISPSLKYDKRLLKSLLLKAFFTILPAEIWSRQKQGFTFPFESWMKNSEAFAPIRHEERKVFEGFKSKRLHWSKYWAIKVSNHHSANYN